MANYSSRLVVEIWKDGQPITDEPTNTLVDETKNLTLEQAEEHHYILKAGVGQLLQEIATVGSEGRQAINARVLGRGPTLCATSG